MCSRLDTCPCRLLTIRLQGTAFSSWTDPYSYVHMSVSTHSVRHLCAGQGLTGGWVKVRSAGKEHMHGPYKFKQRLGRGGF